MDIISIIVSVACLILLVVLYSILRKNHQETSETDKDAITYEKMVKELDENFNKMMQETENRTHYEIYEGQKVRYYHLIYTKQAYEIDKFVNHNPLSIQSATDDIIEKHKYDYIRFANFCKKAGIMFISIGAYCAYMESKYAFAYFEPAEMFLPKTPSFYTIYHEPTAKYKGDTMKMIKEEFENKWFK